MKTFIQKKLFTQNECEYFKSLCNNKTFEQSKILGKNNEFITSDYRSSKEVKIETNLYLSNIILEKIKELGVKTLPEHFVILKYDKNEEVKRHNDVALSDPDRYKTLIIQLSNETDYDGGELCIFQNNKEIITSKEIGNVIMFDSTIDHCVNKIKEGVRYCMLYRLSFSNFGLNKSLI